MTRWKASLAVAAGVVGLSPVLDGCSTLFAPVQSTVKTASEDRIHQSTQSASRNVSPEMQASIDAFTDDAIASIKRSADFLAARNRFSVDADIAYGVLQPNGQMLEFGGTRDFLIRRPDRLRIETINRTGDVTQFFFDGESILIDLPNEDAYVRIERPGTYYAALDYLVEQLGAPIPLEDFISENFALGIEERIDSGFYVQRVSLDDHVCEQFAWRTRDVDVQLWVREGEEPVPCRLLITYKNEPGHPRFAADFHDWDFDPEVDDELFVFNPPESAERLQARTYLEQVRDERKGE